MNEMSSPIRTVTNGDDPQAFWQGVIDPIGVGMPNAIARELSEFTGESLEVVLENMAQGTLALKHLWNERSVNRNDPKSIESFYRDQFIEAYELANWHCGRTAGMPPLNYAKAALLAKRHNLRRVLDFGSGIGSGSLAFASLGCEVHSADIANQLLEFVHFRMQKRGYGHHVIDLTKEQITSKRYYDLIACFDVLEHIPDQLSKLRELAMLLRVGGILCVNLMENSYNPDRPMHVSSTGSNLAIIRATSLVPVWSECDGEFIVLQRRRFGALHNRVAAVHDWLTSRAA